MRRSAATFLTVSLLIGAAGCQQPKPEEDMQDAGAQTATMEPDYFADDPAAQVIADDYSAPADSYAVGSSSSQAPSAGSRTHMVAKGDTLYELARMYYSDQRRWKDIYEANGDSIQNPNLIFVGQVLVIP